MHYSPVAAEDQEQESIRLEPVKEDESSKEIDDDSSSVDGLDNARRSTSSVISSFLGEIEVLKSPGYLTLLHGIALTISLQIGAGIFSTPSQVSQHVQSPGAGVLVWIAGGLLSWSGAACLIELGLAMPQNGGYQEYLSQLWGDFAGFLCSWTTIVLLRPGSMAIVSMIFSEHLCQIILPSSLQTGFAFKCVALIGVGIVVLINCLGMKSGARTATVFLVMKLFAVASVIVLGLSAIRRHRAEGVHQSGKGWFGSSDSTSWSISMAVGEYTTAAFGALYAYGGSSAAGEIAGDLKDPQRDIPRIVNICMAITMVAAVSMNIALYEVLHMETMRDDLIPVVKFGIRIVGSSAGIFYSLVVSMSAIGSINAALFAGARQYVASAERGYIPGVFASLHMDGTGPESAYYDNTLKFLPSFITSGIKGFANITERLRIEGRVPIYPLVVSYLLGAVFIILGTFDGLIVFGGIIYGVIELLLVGGIYKLRISQRNEDGSMPAGMYRTWTINPVIYGLVKLFITITGMVTHPLMAGLLIAFFGFGYLVYRVTFLRQSISEH